MIIFSYAVANAMEVFCSLLLVFEPMDWSFVQTKEFALLFLTLNQFPRSAESICSKCFYSNTTELNSGYVSSSHYRSLDPQVTGILPRISIPNIELRSTTLDGDNQCPLIVLAQRIFCSAIVSP